MLAETSINGNGKRLYRARIPGALRRHSFRTNICAAFAKSQPLLFEEFKPESLIPSTFALCGCVESAKLIIPIKRRD